MEPDTGLRRLAVAVFTAAIEDRNRALRCLSRPRSFWRTREAGICARREAEFDIGETTQFLVSDSFWHQILNIRPEAFRKRLDEGGIDMEAVKSKQSVQTKKGGVDALQVRGR